MFKRSNKFSQDKHVAPKVQIAGKYRYSSKAVPTKQGEVEKTPKAKVAVKRILTQEDLKNQLNAWVENERIPGKMQAWYTKDAVPEHCDWRIVKAFRGNQESLRIESPAQGMETLELVNRINEQIHKEHLRIFKKALQQIWIRAVGDGRFAMLVQINVKGKLSAHGLKTFVNFLEHSCPEIISCHQIQCSPDVLFDPASTTPVRVETKAIFGSNFMPIGNTGFCMHVLDWAPRIKDAWLSLPARIKDAIHPNPEDRFFEFYSSSTYIGASLSPFFKSVDSMDCREAASLSSKMNAQYSANQNMRFHRGFLDSKSLLKFFDKMENEGRWTFYFNLPDGEGLPQGVEQTMAASRPERILMQTSDLTVAAREIKHFRNEGYVLRKSIPLYLEPGCGKLDVLFLFVPDRAGLLGQNANAASRSRNVQRPKELINASKMADIPHFVQKTPSFKKRKD